MKFKEYKSMKPEELKVKLIEIKKELMKENAQVARGTVPKSAGKLSQMKKNIARIHGLITMSEKKTAETEVSQKKE